MSLHDQNLLFFTRTMHLGGTEQVVLQLCGVLGRKVNKIVVCSRGGIHAEELARMGIRHYEIGDIERKSPRVILRTLFALHRIIREEQISVVHTHHRMAAFYAALLGVHRHCTVINTSHNTFNDKRMLTTFAYRCANLAACAQTVKRNLVQQYGIPEGRVTVIRNAVEPFGQNIAGDEMLGRLQAEGAFLVANIGRLSPQKGMEYFIRAAVEVVKPCPQARFLIVGTGEDEAKLRSLANELGLERHVIFMGYRADIQNVIGQTDLVVLSSLWEGLPLTPIEAFSMGKTVVATDVDGTPEIVTDGETGLLVKAGDAQTLAQGIIRMITDDAFRRRLERNARQRYEEAFTLDVMAGAYTRYYQQVIASGNRMPPKAAKPAGGLGSLKKIGVITLHRTSNYGGVLQPFALQKAMEKTGTACEIIDFYPEENTVLGQLKRLRNKSKKLKNPAVYCFAWFAFLISYLKKKFVFETYIRKNLNLSPVTYRKPGDFERNIPTADVYCSGGDQVFHGLIEPRFFPFVQGKPLVSYSASFGKEYVEPKNTERLRALLKRYSLLSVREDSGLGILREMGFDNAVQVVDSTLLLSGDEWSRYASESYRGKKYILTYNLHHDRTIDQYARALSKKYGIPVLNICMHWFEFYRHGKRLWCPPVEDYLSLFQNAEFVIGDSFHGMVYSILFRRRFLSILPGEVGARISSLARLLHLEDRVSGSDGEIPLGQIEKDIDYSRVYQILEREKEKAFGVLNAFAAL